MSTWEKETPELQKRGRLESSAYKVHMKKFAKNL